MKIYKGVRLTLIFAVAIAWAQTSGLPLTETRGAATLRPSMYHLRQRPVAERRGLPPRETDPLLTERKSYLPSINSRYAKNFTRRFIIMLEGVDLSRPSEECLAKIIEQFNRLRKTQPDLWLQPYLMLDDRSAILIFKNGPNSIHFGSKPIAYRIDLNRKEIQRLKRLLRKKGLAAVMQELHIPYDEYLERFDTEERMAIAARSMDHTRHLNYPNCLVLARDNLGTMFKYYLKSDVDNLDADIKNLLNLTKETLTFCQMECVKILGFGDCHKHHKVLCLKAADTKKEGLAAMLERLRFLYGEWRRNRSAIAKFSKSHLACASRMKRIEYQLSTAIPILEAEVDLIEKRSTPSMDEKSGNEALGELFKYIKYYDPIPQHRPAEIKRTKFSVKLDSRFHIKRGRFTVEIEDLAALRQCVLRGNWRALAFSVENAIFGALRASQKARKRPEIKVRVLTKDGQDYLEILIRDYAKGIPRDELFKISDPDYTTKAHETGWAFARRAISDSGGYVKIDSRTKDDKGYKGPREQIGVGTDVTIQWPVERRGPIAVSRQEKIERVGIVARSMVGHSTMAEVLDLSVAIGIVKNTLVVKYEKIKNNESMRSAKTILKPLVSRVEACWSKLAKIAKVREVPMGILNAADADNCIIEIKELLEEIKSIRKEAMEKDVAKVVGSKKVLFWLDRAIEQLQSCIEIATAEKSYAGHSLAEIIRYVCKQYIGVVKTTPRSLPPLFIRGNKTFLIMAIKLIVGDAAYLSGQRALETKIPAEVLIRLTEENGFARIDIIDNGPGIPPKLLAIDPLTQRQRLFNPNALVLPPFSEAALGPIQAWYAVKDGGGRIEVKSELGEGTTFSIWLPIASTPDGGPVSKRSRSQLAIEEESQSCI